MMKSVSIAKNSDYASNDNPFENFIMCEQLGIASTLQGFLTRMLDKIARINTFAKRGSLVVKTESVQDSLLDLANYCILMAAYIKSETDKDFLDNLPDWGSADVEIKVEE